MGPYFRDFTGLWRCRGVAHTAGLAAAARRSHASSDGAPAKKHTVATSRKNGSTATNYGKIKAEPMVVFKESYVVET